MDLSIVERNFLFHCKKKNCTRYFVILKIVPFSYTTKIKSKIYFRFLFRQREDIHCPQNLSNVSKRLQVQSVLERRQLPDIHGRGPSVENREADSARSAAEIPHVPSSWSLAKRDLGLDQPRFAMAPLPKFA